MRALASGWSRSGIHGHSHLAVATFPPHVTRPLGIGYLRHWFSYTGGSPEGELFADIVWIYLDGEVCER